MRRSTAILERPGDPGQALYRGAMIAIKQGDFEIARQMAEEMSQLRDGECDEREAGQR